MTESSDNPPANRLLDPSQFMITRKRKLYRFALFHNSPLCFEVREWSNEPQSTILEMGAGTGLFSVGLAEMYPEQHYVAVDVKADRLQTGARVAEVKGLSNVHFLRARADQLLELIPAHSLTSIWVTFPDPQPKKRAAKNRLLHPRFLHAYKELLQDDGSLYFKTDARGLFEWSLEQFVNEGWTITQLSFDLHDSNLPEEYKIRTTYETRYMNEGLAIMFVRVSPPRR